MNNLAARLANRIQLTTDGHRVYLLAVELAFGTEVDYAMLVKLYGNDSRDRDSCTSYAERQNLTMRMQMRRFTRLTNAFSQKVDNLDNLRRHAVALHFMYYNFCIKRYVLPPRWGQASQIMSGPSKRIVALLDAEKGDLTAQ
jgi:hypothetical protein